MHKFWIALSSAFLSALLAAPAIAQSGDAVAGKRLAETTCAECHAILPGGKPRKDVGAPAFADIAAMPSTTALSIKVFLQTPHKSMPDLILTQQEIDAAAAYILSVKQK